MKTINGTKEFQTYRKNIKSKHIGIIPTMGALHAGHLSLVQQSINDNQITIVSIFINPTQFDNQNDLDKYPNLIEHDLKTLEQAGVDCVFMPTFEQMYPDDYRFVVQEKELSKKFCGAHRDGHFDGVLTVVLKLLNLAQANNAYFGEKDFQQLNLIKQMVAAFFLPVTVISGETIREQDGLAMSSRNLHLTPHQRKIAPLLYQTISSSLSLEQMRAKLCRHGFKVDYLEILNNRLLVAVYLGNLRLIDNVEIIIKSAENAA